MQGVFHEIVGLRRQGGKVTWEYFLPANQVPLSLKGCLFLLGLFLQRPDSTFNEICLNGTQLD